MAHRQDPSQMPGALSIGPAGSAPGYGGTATRDRQAFGLASMVWARLVRRVQEASER
jgi:hypothetical protein